MRRSALAIALAAALPACGDDGPLSIETPARRAFVPDRALLTVRVRADGAYDAVDIAVDGREPVRDDARDAQGLFEAAFQLPAGRHRVVASVPEVPGLVEGRDVFVGRAPDAPVDGYGIGEGGTHALVLSGAAPADDGLYQGRLSVFSIATSGEAVHRVLSPMGVFGEVSAAGQVAWVDGWSGGRGTLHVGPLAGGARARLEGVREVTFAPDGLTLAALDDGVVVIPESGEPRRVTSRARAFVFSGPGGDLAAFEGEDESEARWVTFASAPDYEPAVLVTPVRAVIASNPVYRESALVEHVDGGYGSLVLYEYETGIATRPFDAVGGFTWSRDGRWLLAIHEVDGDGGAIGLLARGAPPSPTLSLGSGISRAGFDYSSKRVFAVASGELLVADLDAPAPALVPVASGIDDLLALPGDRMLLLTLDGHLALVDEDGAFADLGLWNSDHYGVSLSADFRTLAFTAVDGAREPIRRVDLETGHVGDLGQDASRPAALAGGGVAWAERAADGTHDLWLFPAFPASVLGARRLAGAADTGAPFALSPGGTAFGAIAGDRVLCIGADGSVTDLGPADASRRETFFLDDGRLAHFGVDRGEERVLFFRSCE